MSEGVIVAVRGESAFCSHRFSVRQFDAAGVTPKDANVSFIGIRRDLILCENKKSISRFMIFCYFRNDLMLLGCLAVFCAQMSTIVCLQRALLVTKPC